MKFLMPRFGAFNKIQPRYEKLKKHGQEWLSEAAMCQESLRSLLTACPRSGQGRGGGRKWDPGKPQTGDSSSINAARAGWLRNDDPQGVSGGARTLLEKRRLEPGKRRLKPGDPTEWWGLLSAGELGGAQSDTHAAPEVRSQRGDSWLRSRGLAFLLEAEWRTHR